MSHNQDNWFWGLFILLLAVILGLVIYWARVGYSYNNTCCSSIACCPPVVLLPPTVITSVPTLGVNIPVAGDTITLTGTNLGRVTSLTVVYDNDISSPPLPILPLHETFEVFNFYVNSDGTQLIFLSPFSVTTAYTPPTGSSMILHLYYSRVEAPIVFTMP